MQEQKNNYIKENEHIDTLINIQSEIDFNKITILTGNNGSGKSLIRKVLASRLKSENGKKIRSLSMDLRTGSFPELGAFSSFAADDEWIATSVNSLNLIKKIINSVENNDEIGYVILDEFEIGCSEETILALALYINEVLSKINIGCLIITHSRIAVKNLKADYFINIQGLKRDEWLTRDIVPTDLLELEENKLFFAVRERLVKNQ